MSLAGRRTICSLIGSALLVSASAGLALAAYPEKPITVIVPTGTGGTGDINVRTWAPYMEKCLGNGAQIVVVNKPGGGHYNGLVEVANAPADGYTLGHIVAPNITTSIITRKDSAITVDSFRYLGGFLGTAITLSASLDSPLKDVKGVVDAAKAKPLNVGMSAIGSDDHLFVLQFMKLAGITLNSIPFEGEAAGRNAVVGGHVDLGSMSASAVLPYLDQIRPLAVAADKRLADLPDVPTFKELGYDVVGGSRHFFGAPKGLPDDIAATLTSCFDKIVTDPAYLAEAKQRSLPVDPMSAADADAFVHKQYDQLKTIWDADPWIK